MTKETVKNGEVKLIFAIDGYWDSALMVRLVYVNGACSIENLQGLIRDVSNNVFGWDTGDNKQVFVHCIAKRSNVKPVKNMRRESYCDVTVTKIVHAEDYDKWEKEDGFCFYGE